MRGLLRKEKKIITRTKKWFVVHHSHTNKNGLHYITVYVRTLWGFFIKHSLSHQFNEDTNSPYKVFVDIPLRREASFTFNILTVPRIIINKMLWSFVYVLHFMSFQYVITTKTMYIKIMYIFTYNLSKSLHVASFLQ
jgi:aminopeptidase-like protein